VSAPGLGRRAFLQASGGLALLGLIEASRLRGALAALPGPGQAGRFLTAHELDALRAVTARFLPGPPEDSDPGAVEARCAEAIDLLLGAFASTPPLIHAGGPFSNRHGATHDDFADFVPLDAHAELGWRIRIEGTAGKKERAFAGEVVGLQQEYRRGLAHLDARAGQLGGTGFAALAVPLQIVVLSDQTDGDVQSFVGTALSHTIDAMYGPPEYGGNAGLVGWTSIGWLGDSQPLGYPAQTVTTAGAPLALGLQQAVVAAFETFLPA
jgi:gluconate 2-dehydrogenase subunit 3-like protein